jgi:predicted enzyme related to lactoylglutathione lyase
LGVGATRAPHLQEVIVSNPIVHAEIRSTDPDATRAFFGELFGWTYPAGAVDGYTYIDSGVPDALPGGISPLQGGDALVTFYVGVPDIDTAVTDAKSLGGTVVQEPQRIPGLAFALVADPAGNVVGLAQQL